MNSNTEQSRPVRKDRLIQEHIHDPYQVRHKPSEPTVCSTCNAVFRDGRWQWQESWPIDSNKATCPACRRIEDNYPAGEMTLTGPFLQAHREEVLNLVRNQEREENADHPLHRIMKIDERADTVVITTTDIHLPRRIGDLLHQAYKGEMKMQYDEEGYFIRVMWNREQ